ncbi:MAG: prepilin-type N-terminal cleavage/methylation domain-containing protein [Candidatus Sumerlaeota bacterium]|nr:prepilin-type N-terminal cleavage/methylation domain-containing protein [Candidatus Sumerlaeota bacterium]
MIVKGKRNKSGFTLIELLIVIAIIAILALIAIPNFLEAQTRSKVSRSQADMRSVATAIEAYYLDYNSYTWSADNRYYLTALPATASTASNNYSWYGRLSTPVAYITTIPRDPFSKSLPVPGLSDKSYFNFYSGSMLETETSPRSVWTLVGMGPDLLPNIYMLKAVGADPAFLDITNPTPGVPGSNVTNQTTDLPYDPTNGTISAGDVMRTMGNKIEGFLRY